LSDAPQITPADLLRVLQRRLVMILAVASVLSALSVVAIASLKDVYEARMVVLIEPARMPASFEKSRSLEPKLSQLVGILRQEALSRESIREVANELDLYEMRAPAPGEVTASAAPRGWFQRLFWVDPIERARKDIKIDIVKRYGEDYVEISAKARTAELAPRTVNRFADKLAGQNHLQRQRDGNEAKAFLEDLLQRSLARLQESEAALNRFREVNQEALPDNVQTLLDRVAKLRTDVSEKRAQLERARAATVELNDRISSLVQGGAAADDVVSADRAAIDEEIKKLEAEKADFESRGYGPGWPGLRRVLTLLEKAQARAAALDAPHDDAPEGETLTASSPATDGPLGRLDPKALEAELRKRKAGRETIDRAQKLLRDLKILDGMVTSLQRDVESGAAEIGRLEVLKASLASVEASLVKLTAQQEEAAAEHKSLLNDLRNVERMLTAGRAGRADQFKTIEAAEAPLVPTFPNRPLLLAGALVASFVGGFGVALLVELKTRTYYDADEVERDLKVPVLAALPFMARLDPEASPPPTARPREPLATAAAASGGRT